MDLNLYVGLPPLSPPRLWLDTSAPSRTTWVSHSGPGAALDAPRTREPEEPLAPAAAAAAAYSPSNALFAPDPEEHPVFDPLVYSWLDGSGEEYTDAPALSAPAPTPVDGHGISGPQFLMAATGLDGDDLAVPRPVHPSRVAAAAAAAGGLEMVGTSVLGQSTQGATASEAGELRFLRAIRISQQHNIVRPGPASHTQVAASADAGSLVMAMQHTQSAFEAAADPDGGGDKVRGSDAAEKDGSCDCNCDSSFECNICLERAKQPVVTSCGHLFCWPCLYRWLHAQSPFCDCPVCKGEVLLTSITPIYGRGGDEEGDSGSSAVPDLPPRPQANRRDSLRQQLQTATDARGIAAVLREMIQNQGIVTSVPAGRQRAGSARRQRRQGSNATRSAVVNAGNAAPEGSDPIQPPHSNGGNGEQVVHAAPQQPPPAVVLGEPGPSRRSRHSESAAIRRTRRRPQQ